MQELDVTPYAINHQVTRPITYRFLKVGLTYLPCCDVRHVHPLFLTCVIYAETINFIAITSILLCKIIDFFWRIWSLWRWTAWNYTVYVQYTPFYRFKKSRLYQTPFPKWLEKALKCSLLDFSSSIQIIVFFLCK